MSRPISKPLSEILKSSDKDEDGIISKNKTDFRQMKELEEQRKAGTAPAMVDVETGKDINPHIPEFIEKTPWYVSTDGPTLKHQKPHPERQKTFVDLHTFYKKGTTGKIAYKFRKGACENCGAMGHKKKDCFEPLRKRMAKYTGTDMAPDDYEQPELSLNYDAKRDRWNGYDPSTYKDTVVKQFEEMDEIAKVVKAEKIKQGEIAEDDDDDDQYADNMTPGQTVDMDSRTRITVRNLRIREDPAKYLYNLNENGPYYDPKSRSMRENPFLGVPGKEELAAKFAGENYIRYTGEVIKANEAQVFAWQARTKGVDVHATAEPTKLEILQKKVDQEKNALKDSHKKELLEKYGGEEYLETPAKELLLAQTEAYVEYNRRGKVIKGEDKPMIRSKYEEDKYLNNHTSVWGSYWRDGKWGYKCCHSFFKNAYCVGIKGYALEEETYTRMSTNEPSTSKTQELQPKQAEVDTTKKKNDELIIGDNDKVEETTDKNDEGEEIKNDDGALSVEEDGDEEDDEEIDEERQKEIEKELEKEKERREKEEKRREKKREKRKRKKDRKREKSNDKKKKKKKRRSSSSSSDSSSDSSSSEDEIPAKNAKYTPELRTAIKKALKEQKEGKLVKEMSDRDKGYNSQYEVKAPTEVEMEAYNLVRIHSSDPMAAYVQEQQSKKKK